MNANEKLRWQRDQWGPQLQARMADLPLAQRMAAGMALPQLEELVDGFIDLPTDQLDDVLARLVDRIGQLRSDDAPPILVDVDGACYFERTEDFTGTDAFGPWRRVEGFVKPVRAAEVQRPDPAGGPVGVGEVDGGPGALPVGGRPEIGH